MLRSIAQRLRLFLRSELDLQKDRILAELAKAPRAASGVGDLGWQIRQADSKTYVSGLDFTFDNVADGHILKDLEFLAILVKDLGAKVRRLPDGRVEIQIGSVRMTPETRQEVGILVEVFRDEIYLVESSAPMFVWDVGANVGSAALYFAGVLGWDVAAYELFPDPAQAAKDNVSRSGLTDKVSIAVAGVGAKTERLTLPYDRQMRGSNGLYGNDMSKKSVETVSVEVEVLDAVDVLDQVVKKAAGRPILAKFDCEGAEYDIIDRLQAAEKLRALAAIVMELHAIPGLDPNGVIATLTDAGFLVRRSRRSKNHLSIVYATRLGD